MTRVNGFVKGFQQNMRNIYTWEATHTNTSNTLRKSRNFPTSKGFEQNPTNPKKNPSFSNLELHQKSAPFLSSLARFKLLDTEYTKGLRCFDEGFLSLGLILREMEREKPRGWEREMSGGERERWVLLLWFFYTHTYTSFHFVYPNYTLTPQMYAHLI